MDAIKLLVALAATVCLTTGQLLMPPAFTTSPPAKTIYFTDNVGETLTFECVATGNPPPNYEWKKNGETLQVIPVIDGTITFTSTFDSPLSRAHEGVYQCIASNSVGKAMSNTTRAVMAKQASFPGAAPSQTAGTLGMPLQLPCQPTSYGVPYPQATLEANELLWYANGKVYAYTRRVQVDDKGFLNIAYLTQEDLDYSSWECRINNRISKVEVGGAQRRIVNSGLPSGQPSVAKIMFYSNQTDNPGGQGTTVVGLEGQDISLRCFFSGSPDISITWHRTDGGSIPTDGRVNPVNFNNELQIKRAARSDQGMYACSGSSPGFSTVDFIINLIINTSPRFANPLVDGPHNVNATVGEYIKMNCSAQAIPPATVQWFQNGKLIDPKNPPSKKFSFSTDLTSLTVGPVCKDNCTGGNDLMVLQCNASNVYGYALGNGYLNVFVRTVVIMKTENITLEDQKEVSFKVKAVTDPNLPLTYSWYKSSDNCPTGWCTIFNDTKLILSSDDNQNSVLTIYSPTRNEATRYLCVASNGVSSESVIYELIMPPIVAYVWPFWWIPFIILLILLIFIIIVCCVCCYMYRNRGDEYPVDEKERAADRNPEKELVDSGFHDYQRPTHRNYDEEKQPLHM